MGSYPSSEGIDADPAIVARARELTAPDAAVSFTVGDALSETPPGPYDVITCVATIHHLPLSDALISFRRHLAPGGTLAVVGVTRARTLGDHLLDAAAIPLNVVMAGCKNRGREAPRPVYPTRSGPG